MENVKIEATCYDSKPAVSFDWKRQTVYIESDDVMVDGLDDMSAFYVPNELMRRAFAAFDEASEWRCLSNGDWGREADGSGNVWQIRTGFTEAKEFVYETWSNDVDEEWRRVDESLRSWGEAMFAVWGRLVF